MLDTSWMEEYNKYQSFYKEDVENIHIYYIYIDQENSICYTTQEQREIADHTLKKEELLFMIREKLVHHHRRYRLHSILQFNIDLNHQDIVEHKYKEKIQGRKVESIQDIRWEPSINFFMDMNSLYIFFHQPREKRERKQICISTKKQRKYRGKQTRKQYFNLV